MSDDPKPVYLFMRKLPSEDAPVPVALMSRQNAERHPHRISAIVEVHVPAPGDFSQIVCDVIE